MSISCVRPARRTLFAIFLALIARSAIFAQYTTATLNGTVSDPSGASVAEAKVTIQNLETGLTRETQTGSNGAFTATALPVGRYQVSVEKSGFSKYIQSGITLALDQSANVLIQLKVGDLSQQVTVAADAELVNTLGLPEGVHVFHAGVDLYADGVYRGTAIADRDAKPGKTQEHTYFKSQPRLDREITLYLPLYMPVEVLGIGLDPDARVQAARPFVLKGPVVFYGTSITQGGCASRSGMSYQAILGRMLNTDFVNLGFSGNGLGEPELARAVAGIDASCFVMDFAQNNPSVESLAQAYAPFLETIRGRHAETPILVITPIYSSRESWARDARLEGMRELIRQVAARRIAAGDLHLEIVEGTDLLGPSAGDGLVDGTHPNDLGFQWMANGLAGRIARILGLRSER